MSDATPRPTNPAQPTRQQLDELEALMQQMLALPVNELDKESGGGTASLHDSIPAHDESAVPTWQPGPAPDLSQAVASQPVGPRPESSPSVAVQSAPTWGRKVLRTAAPQRRFRGEWLLAPLVWSNRTFDRTMMRLGRPGRWLRSRQGRTVLGWLGVVLLAAALARAIIDVIGWTR
jgi:hypothetical protein